MTNIKEKTGSFKLPGNGTIAKAVKSGGAVIAFLAVSWFYTEIMKPDITAVQNDVKEMQAELKIYSMESYALKYQIKDISILKEEFPKIKNDIAEIKSDIKVILVMIKAE